MTGAQLTGTNSSSTTIPRRLYAVGLADSVGLGIYLAFSTVYLNLAVGLPNYQIGVVLGFSGIASVLGALPLAALAQRIGLRRSLILYFLARGISYIALAFAFDAITAFAAVGVAGLLSRGTGPLVQAASVTDAHPAGAVQALARLRLLRNVGMAAGSLPAAAAVALADEWAFRSVMFLCAAMFLTCSVLSRGLPRFGDVSRPAHYGVGVGRDVRFLSVTAVYGALILCVILLGVGMPLWIVQRTAAPAWTAGFVSLLNTLMVVLLQIRMSKGSEDPVRARRMMTSGGLLAAVAAATAPLSTIGGRWQALILCAFVVVVMTLAELYIAAGSMGLALTHTPPESRPVYLATYNLGFAAATVVGPPLVTIGLTAGDHSWFAWAVAFAVVGILARFLPVRTPKSLVNKGFRCVGDGRGGGS
ncbi:MFS transporter [Micromonospora sp. NPDC047707]|uniref:MFS transporter n=1 Tax=Micromonospora sp. NPDC047707 TaxID=3154498 RepID=UPI0034543030